MSAIDLIILGFLHDKSWSAYELASFVKEHQFHEMMKISTPAIYKNLIKMEKKHYLNVKVVKDSENPERKIYSMTKNGKEYFNRLMKETSLDDIRYYFPFSPFIINLNRLDQAERIEYLHNLKKQFLEEREKFENRVIRYQNYPRNGVSLLKQIQVINDSMIVWVDELIAMYE